MEAVTTDYVATVLNQVAAYGSQHSTVLHNYAIVASGIPRDFDDLVTIVDATVATLNQVLSLVTKEATLLKCGNGNPLFSEDGLKYVYLLAKKCAAALATIKPTFADGCLEDKERKSQRKLSQKVAFKEQPTLNFVELQLDGQAFLEKVENAKWRRIKYQIEECKERLYDLQLHLLLGFQVVTVGALSRERSSGEVDIRSIVTFHDRINRTAAVIGIVPKYSNGRYRSGRRQSSDSSNNDSGTDSSSRSIRPVKRAICLPPPAPAPPPPPSSVIAMPFATTPLVNPTSIPENEATPAPPLNAKPLVASPGNVNPPSYVESHRVGPNIPTPEKASADHSPVNPDVKPTIQKEQTVNEPKDKDNQNKLEPDARLFNSQPNSLRFKINRLFRSKKSLAAEMKKVLCDTESRLTAFIVEGCEHREIPHSAFHSLEATHMKTILSQLNGNSWFQTYSTLDDDESAALDKIIKPYQYGIQRQRDLVVLEDLQQKGMLAWMVLLKDFLLHTGFSYNRFLLVIVREKLIQSTPLSESFGCSSGSKGPRPPPPPPGVRPSQQPISPLVPALRPPPTPNSWRRSTRIQDITYPLPSPPPPPQTLRGSVRCGPGGPPLPLGPRGPSPHPPLPTPQASFPLITPGALHPIRRTDNTLATEYDAIQALTSYVEYTLHVTPMVHPHTEPSWIRASVTEETSELQALRHRVTRFKQTGGNFMETKLHLSDHQNAQVTRLMDDLKSRETDSRFEWYWVEISLYDLSGKSYNNGLDSALIPHLSVSAIHLIAQRTPKMECKPLDVYASLVKPLAPVISMPPPIMINEHKLKTRSDDSHSDSDYHLMRACGRRRLRKTAVGRRRRVNRGSDSDSPSDSDDEVVNMIDLELKNGDDVVKALLDMWTPQTNGKAPKV